MSALSPRQLFLLDEACKPINEALSGNLYLVGTATDKQPYRDVDVRLIMIDQDFDALSETLSLNAITFMGFAIGEYLAAKTGLPIDFQIQRMTEANEKHQGIRNPIGQRNLGDYPGDAAPPNPDKNGGKK